MRVLIVEDTIERQQFLQNLFSAHECFVADSAPRAIEILKMQEIAIVMLDYDLAADTRGTEVAKYIVSSPGDKISVIVHSANPDGVESILEILPWAIALPIQFMNKSNPLYTRLKAELVNGKDINISFLSKATIRFHSVNDEYGCFSNFADYPIKLDGKIWPTSEHYFQAMKFEDQKLQLKIRKTKSTAIAARIGRNRKLKIRRDWDSIKIAIMRKAVKAKFYQHSELAKILITTGDATIVEHTNRDDFWGDGGDGSGRNMLGHIIMDVRNEMTKRRQKT